MTEEQQKILELQTPNTQRLMRIEWGCGTPEDLAWLPGNPIAVPDAKTDEERVGARPLTYGESRVMHTLRYSRGQYLAEIRGEAPVTSVDEAKRARAVDAFMLVREGFLDLMKGWGMHAQTFAEKVAEAVKAARE